MFARQAPLLLEPLCQSINLSTLKGKNKKRSRRSQRGQTFTGRKAQMLSPTSSLLFCPSLSFCACYFPAILLMADTGASAEWMAVSD
jgi:hypothetical protein